MNYLLRYYLIRNYTMNFPDSNHLDLMKRCFQSGYYKWIQFRLLPLIRIIDCIVDCQVVILGILEVEPYGVPDSRIVCQVVVIAAP